MCPVYTSNISLFLGEENHCCLPSTYLWTEQHINELTPGLVCSHKMWEMSLICWIRCFTYITVGARQLSVLVLCLNMSLVRFSHFVQDECSLEPELYERAEKLFRGLLRYVTDFLVWEENLELSAELQPRYGRSDHMQMYITTYKACSLTLIVSSSSTHAGPKTICTTVCCIMMSTTRTTMWSTPCSALLTVMRLKHRHTQHLLTRRYFGFYVLLTFL